MGMETPPRGGEGPDDFLPYDSSEPPLGDPLYPEEPEGPSGISGIPPGIPPGIPSGIPPGIPEFLPSGAQRLLLRIRHRQRAAAEGGRRGAGGEGGRSDREHDEGDPGSWYSSDEDDGASSVTSILKSLRQQTSSRPQNPPGDPPSDPRTPRPPRPSDPRLRDPRLARNPELAPSDPGPSDPRLARHCPKTEPPQKPNLEDEDGERILREKPLSIPLDPIPGHPQRDPRCQLQQFSHIRKDLALARPNFARCVLWSPEDLIPLPVPKQDFPLRATSDPRQHRAEPSSSSSSSSSPPSSAAALPDFELLSRILKTVTASSSSSSSSSSSGGDKPSDPRVRKDPRLQKSLDNARAAEFGEGEAAAIAPYDPRLSWGGSGQSSVLSAISLYDPRTPCKEPQNEGNSTQKSVQDSGKNPKTKEPPFVRRSALEQAENEEKSEGTDRYNSYNRPRGGKITCAGEVGGAQHCLPPVPPVFGVGKSGGSPQEEPPEDGDKSLKDVFKGFDPTASPFCQ